LSNISLLTELFRNQQNSGAINIRPLAERAIPTCAIARAKGLQTTCLTSRPIS